MSQDETKAPRTIARMEARKIYETEVKYAERICLLAKESAWIKYQETLKTLELS